MTSAVFDFPSINRILNRRTQLEAAKIEEPDLKPWYQQQLSQQTPQWPFNNPLK